jgi:hypothetical protein
MMALTAGAAELSIEAFRVVRIAVLQALPMPSAGLKEPDSG